jgi:hypothetical protein
VIKNVPINMGFLLNGYGATGFFLLSQTHSCEPRVLHATVNTFVPTLLPMKAGSSSFPCFLLQL